MKPSAISKRRKLDNSEKAESESALSDLARKLAALNAAAKHEPMLSDGMYVSSLLNTDQH